MFKKIFSFILLPFTTPFLFLGEVFLILKRIASNFMDLPKQFSVIYKNVEGEEQNRKNKASYTTAEVFGIKSKEDAELFKKSQYKSIVAYSFIILIAIGSVFFVPSSYNLALSIVIILTASCGIFQGIWKIQLIAKNGRYEYFIDWLRGA